MDLAVLLAPLNLTVLDIISYLGLAAMGTMSLQLFFGIMLASKYDPVVSWPHRPLPLFRIHNILAYFTLTLMFAHPALLLLVDKQGFVLLEILVPMFAPKQPFENTLGALAAYGTLVVVITSYLPKRWSPDGNLTFRAPKRAEGAAKSHDVSGWPIRQRIPLIQSSLLSSR